MSAFAEQAAAPAILEQGAGARQHAIDVVRDRLRLDEVIPLVREIDGRLERRDEIEERRVDLSNGAGQRAIELIERRARLQWCRGVDEIGNGLGLG